MTVANSASVTPPTHRTMDEVLVRLLGNTFRSPRRFCRSVSRWFSGAYEWESRAACDVARWLAPTDQAVLSGICGTGHRTQDRLIAWLATQAPPTGCLVDIGHQGTHTAAWLAMGALQHATPSTVVSIGPEIHRVWHLFEQQARTAHLHKIPDSSSSDLYAPTMATYANVSSGPNPIPVDSILRRLRQLALTPAAAASTWRDPISLLSINMQWHTDELSAVLRQMIPHVAPGGWIVATGVQGRQAVSRQQLAHDEIAAHADCAHAVSIRSLLIFRKRAN